jgi:hypothetical protein
MYNYYAPFLFSRYATTITDVFHRDPCAGVGPPLGGRRLSVLTVHPGGTVPNCTAYWHGAAVAPATDDHPFPYLPNATLPGSYWLMLGLILLGPALLVRVAGGSFGPMRGYLDTGALEYIALITGYHFLLIVVGVLYGLAFMTGRLPQRA